jgi:hypothetical protein
MKNSPRATWPNDVDGDVFRRMQSSGFDFDAPSDIEFNVDFAIWPPPDTFFAALRGQFPTMEAYPPDEDGDGYVLFVVHAPLTYELVMSVQSSVSALAAPFGGVCESWGAMQ